MFEHLSKLQVTPQRTSRYTLYMVEGEPYMELAPATESNKPYYNELLRLSKGAAKRVRMSGVTTKLLAENRDHDRVLFPKHIVRSWNVKDDQGNPAPFDQGTVEAYLRALPDWIFDDVRSHAGDMSNFLVPGEKTPEEHGETAGN